MHITELCPSEKATYCMIPIKHSRKGKTVETVKRSMVARGVKREGDEYIEHRTFSGW